MRLTRLALLLALTSAIAGAQPSIPAPSDTRLARADSLYVAQSYKDAATVYATAAAAAPLDNRSRYRYAISLMNTGDYKTAAALLDQAAVNGNPPVLYNAGSVHARLGHVDTAFAYLNMAIAAGFSNLQILSADSGYMRVRSDARYAAAEKKLKDAFTPCVNNPESHRLDFWVGEWNVTNVTGQPAGVNSVQKILGDCVVFENWTDAQGGQGKSINAFNRVLGQWQQFWMDQYGSVTEYRSSEWVGSSLRYSASTTNRQGQQVLLRMTFTPLDANTVRQQGETSLDGGKTWTPGYDLRYHRKK